MKQVFPDIRPRRLGTRGHSRYCYAAMRKATKLEPPALPDISSKSDTSTRNTERDDSTWQVIKSWSENLLNTQFESADDLASHISQSKLGLPSTSTSKHLLQKKIMQREVKDRKKNIVIFDVSVFRRSQIIFFLSESIKEAPQKAQKVVGIA